MSRQPVTEFGFVEPAGGLAYGIDDTRKELYSLRQARYQALGFDLNRLAGEAASEGRRLRVLDIGAGVGLTRKYLDAWPHAANVDLYGTDVVERTVFRRQAWAGFWMGDLIDGYPEIPSDFFDVVICEQVLEHLTSLDVPLTTLTRVLRPGGTLIAGVPIFPHGLHALRAPLVGLVNLFGPRKRGHVRAFSRITFTRLLRDKTGLVIEQARGFRIVSGGPLRPLENLRSWWRFNRWLGKRLPGLCIEIQVLARKPLPAAPAS